jgi:predicted TIM-barrel fold metal-dependent hydrolase
MPLEAMPPLACDCHSHILGPYARFPLPGTANAPPEATLERYNALLSDLSVERAVLVQPLAYRNDNAAAAAAIAERGAARTRGIAIVNADVRASELKSLSDAGFKGVRIMTTEPGALGLGDAAAIASRVEPLGWHLLVQGDGAGLEDSAELLLSLPTPVVIDHVGRLPRGGGIDHPSFRCLLRLLRSQHIWMKLSAFYYGFTDGPEPDAEIAARVRCLAAERPDRLIWGLNWPHPRFMPDNKPDDRKHLEAFLTWLPDPAVAKQILADNPARLYGFD